MNDTSNPSMVKQMNTKMEMGAFLKRQKLELRMHTFSMGVNDKVRLPPMS